MFLAGTDTTSGNLARILHLLAIHPQAQDKLREELEAAKDYTGQALSYEQLMDLPLLDAVCKETFRLCASSADSEYRISLMLLVKISPCQSDSTRVSYISFTAIVTTAKPSLGLSKMW